MYRRTDRQASLFDAEAHLSPATRNRLDSSWAPGFARAVLPALLSVEDQFASLYAEGNGRPNWSVARMLGIMVLAEWFDLTDQDALDTLAFDARWQHALGIPPSEAYLSRRSFVAFRARLAAGDTETLMRTFFGAVRDAALTDLRVRVVEQRLDSTRIESNVRARNRLCLFADTLGQFLLELRRVAPGRVATLPAPVLAWFERERESDWGPKGVGDNYPPRLLAFARLLVAVRDAFLADEDVRRWESYQLVVRVIEEHILVVPARERVPAGSEDAGAPDRAAVSENGGGAPAGPAPTDGSDGPQTATPSTDGGVESAVAAGEESPPPEASTSSDEAAAPTEVTVLTHGRGPSTGLNAPADPDATFGHKGQGYHVQIAETCDEANPVEIITDFDVHGAHVADAGQAQRSIERLAEGGLRPGSLYVDAGYTQGSAFLDAERSVVDLIGPARMEGLRPGHVGRDACTYDPDTGLMTKCPAGHPVDVYRKRIASGGKAASPHAFISREFCDVCPLRKHCAARPPKNGKHGKHYFIDDNPTLRERDRRIVAQRSPDWQRRYKRRIGIEATNSELKRRHGLGKLRVRRLPKVTIAVAAKLTACNVKRWLQCRTRTTPATRGRRTYKPRLAGPK